MPKFFIDFLQEGACRDAQNPQTSHLQYQTYFGHLGFLEISPIHHPSSSVFTGPP